MKIKTVIFLKTRHRDVSYHSKKKLMKDGNSFVRGSSTYMTDTNDFMLERHFKNLWYRTYITYYYREGHATALPVPLFEGPVRHTQLADDGTQVVDEKKKPKLVSGKDEKTKILDTGIQGPELNAIFTPKFYQIIARKERNAKQDIMYYLALITCGAAIVGAWLTYKMPETIGKLLHGG